jgi:hypothetical protein
MSFYVPTTSLSKFMNSTEYNSDTNEYMPFIEPLHISTKYVDFQNKQRLIDSGFPVKEHHSRIVRPPYWDTDLQLK